MWHHTWEQAQVKTQQQHTQLKYKQSTRHNLRKMSCVDYGSEGVEVGGGSRRKKNHMGTSQWLERHASVQNDQPRDRAHKRIFSSYRNSNRNNQQEQQHQQEKIIFRESVISFCILIFYCCFFIIIIIIIIYYIFFYYYKCYFFI